MKVKYIFIIGLFIFTLFALSQSVKALEPAVCKGEGVVISQTDVNAVCCAGLTMLKPKWALIGSLSGVCSSKCGDGICDPATESNYNCPKDCTTYDGSEVINKIVCGNSICETGETTATCPKDCPAPKPAPVCGDDICEGNENNTHQVCTTNLNPECYAVKNCVQDCGTLSNVPQSNNDSQRKSLISKILQLMDQLKNLLVQLLK